jgi:alpha-L-fucosidase 2
MYYFTTIAAGATMDMQILKDLFSYYTTAAGLLEMDTDYSKQVSIARGKLVPSQIGKDGSLQEWADDLEQLEDKHRHFSHMYGLYPGNVLSAKHTPELVDGIKSVLEQRGDGGTGFSRAWKMALWARLSDGQRAHSIYKGYLEEQCYMSLFAKCFTPLQVDGSLGMTAAITEMLVQSHEDEIRLLPAIPEEWENGSFNGVCVRGGFELDYSWKNAKVETLKIKSKAGSLCRINAGSNMKPFLNGKAVAFSSDNDGTIEFETVKGATYILK